MALDTCTAHPRGLRVENLQTRAPRLRWAKEEDETILSHWKSAMRPCGMAESGFIDELHKLFPHRTRIALKHQMYRLMGEGRIPSRKGRVTYRPLALLPTQAAWLAGILDGEGSIRSIYGTRRVKDKRATIQVVPCYNTDLAIIEKVRTLVPSVQMASHPYTRVGTFRSTKTMHTLILSGFDAVRDYLNVVLPYMAHTEKRKRAEAVLDFIRRRSEC